MFHANVLSQYSPPFGLVNDRDPSGCVHVHVLDPSAHDSRQLLLTARALRHLRRSREHILGDGLFSDPAWDILLTLYVAKLEQLRLKVSNVIDESGVPSTTGLRWLNALVERNLVIRSNNPTDARSTFVELNDSSAELMSRHLRGVKDLMAISFG